MSPLFNIYSLHWQTETGFFSILTEERAETFLKWRVKQKLDLTDIKIYEIIVTKSLKKK